MFNNISEPDEAARWTIDQIKSLRKEVPNKPLVVKECGWPAGPEPAFGADQQAVFWRKVLEDPIAKQVNFCVFEASFKTEWKREWVKVDRERLPKDPTLRSGDRVDIGRYWSVFTPDRQPRQAAKVILEAWEVRVNKGKK